MKIVRGGMGRKDRIKEGMEKCTNEIMRE